MSFARYKKPEGKGGNPTDPGLRRCEVCGKEFGRKRYASGKYERLTTFATRVACSTACGARRGRAAQLSAA